MTHLNNAVDAHERAMVEQEERDRPLWVIIYLAGLGLCSAAILALVVLA